MRKLLMAAVFIFFAASGAQAQTWTLDPAHSAAHFAVRHMMVSTVRGDMGKVTGTVNFDGKNLAAATVDVTIDVAGINTREEKRDAHLRGPDFFDVATYPTMTFKSKKITPNADGSFKLAGDLTMHGVTKEVTLEAEPLRPIVRTGTTATTKINRQDFGVKWSKTMDGGGLVVGKSKVLA